MKAFVNNVYGPPEVLELKTIEKPVPKDNEVLIKIHATTVNRTDCGFRNPTYFLVRLISGLFRPRKKILGSELAGEVETVGKHVTLFKPGDQVFGLSTYTFGTHAEYICMNENRSIAIKPVNMSYQEAAAVCDGAFLAYANIKKIDFSHKPKILINGASGSIGTAAVQLAKHFGAEITAVCSTKNGELLKSLGAKKVIDYTQEDFTTCNEHYDIIFDAVGKSSFFKCKKILKPKGIYFSTELGYGAQNIFLAIFTPLFGKRKVMFPIPKDRKEDILFFKELIEAGAYRAVIDRTYPFEHLIEATKYVETGEKTGNVVITVL
ncbi:MAG TPA: NAD(P)-dependent alcohol dehydrogenase [Bacteroidia bacterium]|jgi:NADPH:quinone reductase-like Zn-dependent oxidoreductase|nr:NAD(P)-dependent alcohol dehydrogenase [Bacteroidia bacterium]